MPEGYHVRVVETGTVRREAAIFSLSKESTIDICAMMNGSNKRVMVRCRSMPTEHILSLLIAERDKLNRAIEVLQGTTKRRGRPSQNVEASTLTVTNHRRGGMSAAARKAQSKRMRAYWAKRRKQAAK